MKRIVFALALVMPLLLLASVVMAPTYEEAQAGAQLTVNEFVDITLTGVPVDFGSLDPGTSDNPGNPSASVPQPVTITIESTTNIVTDTYLKGDDFTTPATLAISNILYDDDDQLLGLVDNTTHETSETTLNPANLATSYAAGPNAGYFEDVPCPCGGAAQTKDAHFWITIPSGQQAGTYTATTIYIKTIENGQTP